MMKSVIGRVRKKFFPGKGDSDLDEVYKGGAYAFLYRVGNMLAGYGLFIFISRYVGVDALGVFNISQAVLVILVMVGCIGFNTSIVRFVAEYRVKGWLSLIRSLYGTIVKYAFAVSLALAVGLYMWAPYLAVNEWEDERLIVPLRITAATIPFSVLATINVEFIRGLKQVHISEFFRNLSFQAVAFIGTAIAVLFSADEKDPVLYYGVGAVLTLIATAYFIRRFFRRESKNEKVSEEAPPVFSFKYHFLISVPMILTSFIQLINGKIDTVMLASFETTYDVGVFTMALKVSVITNFVIGAFKTIAMPKVSELFWSHKYTQLNNVMHYSTKVIFLYALPITLLLLIFPEFILGLIKEDFIPGARTLQIFAVTQLIHASAGMVPVFLNMSGNQAFFTKLVAVSAVLNIGLNLLLIPKYSLEGAAWATLAGTAFWIVAGALFIYKKYGISTFYNPFFKKAEDAHGAD